MRFVYTCPDGSFSVATADGVDVAQCAEGQGAWVEATSLTETAGNTPEAQLLQVAMVAAVAFAGMKGLSVGLQR